MVVAFHIENSFDRTTFYIRNNVLSPPLQLKLHIYEVKLIILEAKYIIAGK